MRPKQNKTESNNAMSYDDDGDGDNNGHGDNNGDGHGDNYGGGDNNSGEQENYIGPDDDKT